MKLKELLAVDWRYASVVYLTTGVSFVAYGTFRLFFLPTPTSALPKLGTILSIAAGVYLIYCVVNILSQQMEHAAQQMRTERELNAQPLWRTPDGGIFRTVNGTDTWVQPSLGVGVRPGDPVADEFIVNGVKPLNFAAWNDLVERGYD